MSPYIETIQLCDGELRNLAFHQQRFERTRLLELGLKEHPLLDDFIAVPDGLERGLYKCRVLYGHKIELIEYEAHEKKVVRSLKAVYPEHISYGFKFRDRKALDELYAQRGGCDDILIVNRGKISDSYYANVVCWNGQEWLTPDTPLLPGTMRARLLEEKIIKEVSMGPGDLKLYSKIRLINALNTLEDAPEVAIESVIL